MPYGDVKTDKVFTNGQLGIDGGDLNSISGQMYIQPGFYSNQVPATSTGDSDYLVLLSAGGSFYKILYSNFFANQKWLQAALLPFVNTLINGDTLEILLVGLALIRVLQEYRVSAGVRYADPYLQAREAAR